METRSFQRRLKKHFTVTVTFLGLFQLFVQLLMFNDNKKVVSYKG